MSEQTQIKSEEYEHAMNMLFTARWNIPQASKHLGKVPAEESWEETKIEFRQYCVEHPVVWSVEDKI
jgi:hypothetical protein